MESMEEANGETSAEAREQARQQNTADNVGAAPVFPFPTSHADPTLQLAPLRDKRSTYAAVAKACLHLNQFSMNGSSSASEDVTSSGICRSSLIHDPSMAASLSEAFRNLIECIQNHLDRRAKIVCAATLGSVARAAYAKLRHSPQIFALRDNTNTRLEDEVGTDIPMALISTVLEDADDGVAASALQALGGLCLSTGTTAGTLVEDELSLEIASLTQQRPSPYAPTLADVEDEESYIPVAELQTRILENVVGPRLLQIVWRVIAFQQEDHVAMILPVLIAALVHLSKTSITLYTMDRQTYTKRWVEHDYVNLINTVMNTVLIPAMQSSHKGQLAHVAAMSAIRLIHACPHGTWVSEACDWATLTLKEELSIQGSLESTMTNLSCLLVCARAVPLPDRTPILIFCLNKIRELPSTTMAPHGIHCAGLLLKAHGMQHYRRPARVSLLTELALSFFADGPIDSSADIRNPRKSSLDHFFKSSDFSTLMKEMQNDRVAQLREELTLVFCMVAAETGQRHKGNPEISSNPSDIAIPREESVEWARMALMVLNTFRECLTWESSSNFGVGASYMDQRMSFLDAAQASFARLALEINHAMGLISPTSVTFRMVPIATPPHLLWSQMEEAAARLGEYTSGALDDWVLRGKAGKIMNGCIKKELSDDGIGNHHLRTYLLALASDQWVQHSTLIQTRTMLEGNSSGADLNASSAIDLLDALSPQRTFGKIVDKHRSQIDAFGKKDKDMYKKYAHDTVGVCVACIENIALSAEQWRKRFGDTPEGKHIYNTAITTLQGDPNSPVLPICQGAIDRIKEAFSNNDGPNLEGSNLSPLLLNANEVEKRPYVTAARLLQGRDAYQQGYLMMLSRLAISERIDRCIFAMPFVQSIGSIVRKQNWLRLSLPPHPVDKEPQVPVSSLPKFSWGTSASAPLGGSDAAAMTLAYSMRRAMRYDGENDFKLTVTMRLHNISPVGITEGLRLNLTFLQELALSHTDGHDSQYLDSLLKALDCEAEAFVSGSSACSAMTTYKAELKSGHHLTWQVVVDALPLAGALRLQPSVEFRSLDDEAPEASWIGIEGKDDEDASATSEPDKSSKNIRDDGETKDNERKANIAVEGHELQLSPMVGLQPCPFVFFRDCCGDIEAFRFLWERLPSEPPPLKLVAQADDSSPRVSFDTVRLAALSTVKFNGNAIRGGEVTKLWAFASVSGKRVLCALVESSGGGHISTVLHVRSDDKKVTTCLVGTASARQAFVAALAPGFAPSQ